MLVGHHVAEKWGVSRTTIYRYLEKPLK
ncbi:helix-turn-helix domain-containing protein [Peribacillus loiseleuriae]